MSSLADTLSSLLKDSVISDEKVELLAYRDIAFPDRKSTAQVIVCPKEEDDVVTLLRYCHENRLPVVPWGGGSNLCGALSPGRGHVILDLRQLNRIVELWPEKGFIRVQAGATIMEVQRAAEGEGAFFGHDPWSRRSATVGGSIALDAAGTLYSRYGSMGDQVLTLKLALATGEVLTLGKPLSKISSMPRFPQLFVGSEGAFGVILEAELKLRSRPETFAPLAYGFASFEDMFSALQKLRKAGLLPDSFIAGTLPKRVTEELPKKEQLLIKLGKISTGLYLCCCGKKEVVDTRLALIKESIGRCGRELPRDYAEEWWETRHTYFEASPEVQKAELYPHVLDLTMPLDRVLEMKDWVELEVGKAGLSEALSHTLFTTPDAYTVAFYLKKGEKVEELQQRIDQKAVELGGTLTRTHGMGRLFTSERVRSEQGEGAALFLRRLKELLDPHDILNPGVMGLSVSAAKEGEE